MPPDEDATTRKRALAPQAAMALVDWQIAEAVEADGLISEGYQPESARYATYEAHASDYVQVLTYSEDAMTAHVRRRVTAGEIWISPGETVKIYTEEVFNLGDHMYAMVTGLGQLYACGLTIGNTYVDPGSRGAIYLAVTNVSARAVGIPVGCPIARVQFWRLGERPSKQHPGHQARRRIELSVGIETPETHDGRALGKVEPLVVRPVRTYEVAFVVQTFFFLGLFWYANPASFHRLFRFAAGDGLPPVAHFLVPAVMGPVIFFALRAAWRLLWQPLKQTIWRTLHTSGPD